MHVALYQPEIPPNTGNIIRLCANTGARLHLIHPLGFRTDDKSLARAGLDYHEQAVITHHDDWAAFTTWRATLSLHRLWAYSSKATTRYDTVTIGDHDMLLFGPETRGLPTEVMTQVPEAQRLRLPMRPGSRSLNLSNAVAVALYGAWASLI
jgi:tRNA (cytidine/uridine-2'-O-)-methyltransferase